MYNVTPDKAANYFNKIQCFCFEEQRLLAGEVRVRRARGGASSGRAGARSCGRRQRLAPSLRQLSCCAQARALQTVDMPVFFYLDPEMAADWNCRNVSNITLSYRFHKVGVSSGVRH